MLNKELVKDNTILKGMRRNGMLAWRPDPIKGCMVRADTQAWAKDLPEGSHRLKVSWIKPRYSWIEASGRPKEADWRNMKMAKKLQDMEEAAYCAEQEDMIRLCSFPQEPFEANPGADLGIFALQDVDYGGDIEDSSLVEQQAMLEAMELQVIPAKKEAADGDRGRDDVSGAK